MVILYVWICRCVNGRGRGSSMAHHTENRRQDRVDHEGYVGGDGGRDTVLGSLFL